MIRGRSVGLRPIEPADLELLKDLANDPDIVARVVGWDFPVSAHGQAKWLDASSQSQVTVRLMVQDLESGEPIGMTGLWDIDWHNRSALSALKLRMDRTGRGQGTDAVLTLMAWTFYVVGLRRLHSSILDFNEPSMRTYVGRCGWKVEGREREAVFRKGEWRDLFRVAALRADFDALEARDEYVNRVCPVDVAANVPVAPEIVGG